MRHSLPAPFNAHSQAPFRTEFGTFTLHAFESAAGRVHVALVAGDLCGETPPLVRLQSSCLTGTAFHALLCDCRQQLHLALSLIAAEGRGCVLYLDQEGRSHGLVEKVAQLALIAEGADTVEAAELRHRGPDLRSYNDAADILSHLMPGVPLRLLTNNPEKLEGLRRAGVNILLRVPLEVAPTQHNIAYLRVKRDRMGHILTQLPSIAENISG